MFRLFIQAGGGGAVEADDGFDAILPLEKGSLRYARAVTCICLFVTEVSESSFVFLSIFLDIGTFLLPRNDGCSVA